MEAPRSATRLSSQVTQFLSFLIFICMSLFVYLSQTGDMPGSKISNAPVTHFSRLVYLPLLNLMIDSQAWKPYYNIRVQIIGFVRKLAFCFLNISLCKENNYIVKF